MRQALHQVRAAYDADPEREWHRLETGAQARLEYLITRYALVQHLPPVSSAQHLLDAGGGPGRYTIHLAALGYQVTLFDLSPAILALARQRIAKAGPQVQQHVAAVHEGSITDLSRFPDAHFTAVLCLGGVLSHLTDAGARQQAVVELRRVARPAAPIFISVMNRFGAYRSALLSAVLPASAADRHHRGRRPRRPGLLLSA